MTINTLTTHSRVKKRHNKLLFQPAEYFFGGRKNLTFFNIPVEYQSNTSGYSPTLGPNVCEDTGGYLIFPFWIYYNDGSNKNFRFYVGMIRKSDNNINIARGNFSIANPSSSLTFNSFYYDAGKVYANYTDNTTPTNHYVYYDYATNTYGSITAGQYTSGVEINEVSVAYDSFSWNSISYVLNSAPTYYYGFNIQIL